MVVVNFLLGSALGHRMSGRRKSAGERRRTNADHHQHQTARNHPRRDASMLIVFTPSARDSGICRHVIPEDPPQARVMCAKRFVRVPPIASGDGARGDENRPQRRQPEPPRSTAISRHCSVQRHRAHPSRPPGAGLSGQGLEAMITLASLAADARELRDRDPPTERMRTADTLRARPSPLRRSRVLPQCRHCRRRWSALALEGGSPWLPVLVGGKRPADHVAVAGGYVGSPPRCVALVPARAPLAPLPAALVLPLFLVVTTKRHTGRARSGFLSGYTGAGYWGDGVPDDSHRKAGCPRCDCEGQSR